MKGSVPQAIGLYAKRARGRMARFMVRKRVENPEGLKTFEEDGYAFEPELSSDDDLVFVRNRQ